MDTSSEGEWAMPIVMFLNLKGGVAKTTNTVCVAEQLAAQGKKVLVVDADHQSLAGELLLGVPGMEHVESRKRTLHDLLAYMLSHEFTMGGVPEYVSHKASNVEEIQPNLDCIACSHRIDEFVTNMAKAKKGFKSNEEFLSHFNRLRRLFARWFNQQYDYTLIDCPPSFALQVQFLLGVADSFIIPSIPDPLSVRGSLYLIERIRMRGYTRIHCLGTLWCMVRVQVKKHLEIMQKVRRQEREYASLPSPFRTYIPNSSAIADAMDSNKTYPTYRAKYQPQVISNFRDVCKEIVDRINQETVSSPS